jgi:preprotein translocase subunit SecA
MVTKAIERAQTTVEQRNAEIRKNVLKYDEVMNEQRKVIYALRDQVLDEADLRERIIDEALPDAVNSLVETHCVSEYSEEWDLDGLLSDVRGFWPSTLSPEQLRSASSTTGLYEMLMAEALTRYEEHEAKLGPDRMRTLERRVMLGVIDQRWRAHLYEMDYLREGINLRAMGQKDPLVEWQREGFDMFGQMMHGIWQDAIRYLMHVEIEAEVRAPVDGDGGVPAPAAAPTDAPAPEDATLRDVQYSSPDESATGGGAASLAAAARAEAAAGGAEPAPAGNGATATATAQAARTNAPVVKSDWDKTPRNAPCPCGSGRKFKACHGRS